MSVYRKIFVATAASLVATFAWEAIAQRQRHQLPPHGNASDDFLYLPDEFDEGHVLGLINELRVRQGQPVVLVVHTSGGGLSSVARLAHAVHIHGEVIVWVPFRALSGGTLIAIAGKRIVLWRDACLGAVDPQLPVGFSGWHSTHSVEQAASNGAGNASHMWLAASHEGRRATNDVTALLRRFGVGETAITRLLNENHTHGYPIFFQEANDIGLNVVAPPPEIARMGKGELMALMGGG